MFFLISHFNFFLSNENFVELQVLLKAFHHKNIVLVEITEIILIIQALPVNHYRIL